MSQITHPLRGRNCGLVGLGETRPVGPTHAEAHSAGTMAQGLIGPEVLPLPLHHRMDSLLTGHSCARPQEPG
ncbi:MAG: hypothetical protein V4712_07060 [Pseudomonadota bacterium]